MLILKNFCVCYSQTEIIKDLNIEVDFSSIVAVIGNNGVGKSTFLCALNKKLTSSGTLLLKGRNLESWQVSFLGQGYTFNFPFTVGQFIRLNEHLDQGQECYLWLVNELKIADLLTKNITEISSGQLQKCLIAQTLIQNVDVILLDEPEIHLDLKNRKLLAQVLRSYVSRFNKILFFSSHDFYLIEKSADYLLNFSKINHSIELSTKENLASNFEFLLV